ncbi:MAG: hypothetical protein ACJASF_002485 [Vicingaceae bacterium]|jgi:hypothetical protein
MIRQKVGLLFMVSFGFCQLLTAQTDTTSTQAEEEEDYSMYDNLDFVDEGVKRYAPAKIKGISPAKLITIGYDFQGKYDMTAAEFTTNAGTYAEQTATVNSTQGLRLEANIPVISNNSLIVQVGARLWDINYDFEDYKSLTNPLLTNLQNNNLTSVGLNSTIYKPLNEKSFLLFQLAADVNGDYDFNEFQNMRYTKYSVAAIWGKRPSDNKQWGIGLSRTYRAGEMNYIPVVLYNWTSTSNTWGTEILFPARAHMRYTVNTRSMFFLGYELEGNSYRIGNQGQSLADQDFDELEIRRSELRFRLMYERQIKGFIWMSAQAGYRYNYSYNVDQLNDGDEFFRGFFGDQEFVQENDLTNPLYVSFSINLVSP